jgi:hypothetical protein
VKCRHCSAFVPRNSWFCPNCRQSISGARRTLHRWIWYLLATLAAGAAGLLGAAMLPRVLASGGDAGDAGPVVAIEALPPRPPAAAGAAAEPEADVHLTAADGSAPRVPGSGRRARGILTVYTVPPVKTFVYLNGSELLGEAPLRNASVPAGRHYLVLWSPETRSRSTRTIEVVSGGTLTVIENIAADSPSHSEPPAPDEP